MVTSEVTQPEIDILPQTRHSVVSVLPRKLVVPTSQTSRLWLETSMSDMTWFKQQHTMFSNHKDRLILGRAYAFWKALNRETASEWHKYGQQWVYQHDNVVDMFNNNFIFLEAIDFILNNKCGPFPWALLHIVMSTGSSQMTSWARFRLFIIYCWEITFSACTRMVTGELIRIGSLKCTSLWWSNRLFNWFDPLRPETIDSGEEVLVEHARNWSTWNVIK